MIPLYLFSLPRSGSTLIQRMIGAHDQVATTSEPWILLPYLYTLKEKGIYSEYEHKYAVIAIEDFCRELPRGKDDYLEELRNFVLRLYSKGARKDVTYFLDKSPRYHLIVEDIFRLFPQGKFIFLWRNPLAIIASMMETWANGKWNAYEFKVDLFDGFSNLLAAHEKHAGHSVALRYEDLIDNPECEMKRLFEYLELPFDPELLSRLTNVQLKGRMGDSLGGESFKAVSKKPLENWKGTLANPIRKAWCRHYLKWIGEKRLAVMGYKLDDLLSELDSIPFGLRFVGSDTLRILYGILFCIVELRILKHKLELLPRWHRVHRNG